MPGLRVHMRHRLLMPCLFFLFIALLYGVVCAEENPKDLVSARQVCDRAVCDDICELIKNDLKRGVDAKAVTKANILLGNNVCFVIKCVIDGDGELKALIAGAVEAGSTPDVVSRCCLNAGVNAAAVAQALKVAKEPAGQTDSQTPADIVPTDPKPTPDSGNSLVSPSSF